MQNSAWSEKDFLIGWTEDNCRHLDLIASWDGLVNIYEQMKFVDEINDTIRLGEFKEIIQETNKFLTRMKTGLLTCSDFDTALSFLQKYVDTKSVSDIRTRAQLATRRQQQQWVIQSMKILDSTNQMFHIEREEDEDV